jgi:hypothetical protein
MRSSWIFETEIAEGTLKALVKARTELVELIASWRAPSSRKLRGFHIASRRFTKDT